MEQPLTGKSPGPSTRVFAPSCSSTPGQLPVISPVLTSQDSEVGLIESSDLELSVEDTQEIQTIDDFILKGCGCKYGPGNTQCCSFFDQGNS